MCRRDYLLLTAVCVLLFGYVVFFGRELTGHQSVLPQSSREMLASGEWLTPTIGGRPWLERPPLPNWIVVAFASVVGRCDAEWIVRLPAACMAVLVVLMVAWMASRWYGRNVGVLGGLILATMWEFFFYAANPEADIFLCAIVTGAIALFVKMEFFSEPDSPARADGHALAGASGSIGFFGRRSLPVVAFFVLLGMTNLAKGLIFGTLMVAVPVGSYLLLTFDKQRIRRYVWLWGWLAFLIVGGAWPLAMYWKHPDVLELWSSDYLGRLNHGHVGEPRWYYLVTLPWVILPWTLPAVIGLWLTRRSERHSPARFIWCWALLTPVFFSLPDGKHHHYLLHCLAPWAMLAALGTIHVWRRLGEIPTLVRNPAWIVLFFALPCAVLVAVFSSRIPGPSWLIAGATVGLPTWAFVTAWAATWRDSRRAVTVVIGSWILFYWMISAYQANYLNSYTAESQFLGEVRAQAGNRPLFVHFDTDLPLETFRLLFYSDARLLPNLTFLVDERIATSEVLVIARLKYAVDLASYGNTEVLKVCETNRGLSSPEGRRALFRLTLHDSLPRRSTDVYMTPMQVVHRTPGPFLLFENP